MASRRVAALAARYRQALSRQDAALDDAQRLVSACARTGQGRLMEARRSGARAIGGAAVQQRLETALAELTRLRNRLNRAEQKAEQVYGALPNHPRVWLAKLRILWLRLRAALTFSAAVALMVGGVP